MLYFLDWLQPCFKIVIHTTWFFSDICQIRLDFTQTLLAAPVAATGVCTDDTLVFAPGATNLAATSMPPNLCGQLTGQHRMHIYWSFGIKLILSPNNNTVL